ncbi:hypothetical protein MIND_00357200 [Mycena indigotica]|uniref:F-box domain-containing protein n=1 Tax=Mycena indigotica TaxID=2126181 RepID=A0A8H6T420_9AGAR|nr:uncharacterized protein MIND_00357200 [Mycena indigotica]KAF7309851.1 hypothetical protein MIND_00357200 [Mycena indigotica]
MSDLDELARFREEWKREVEQRRNPQPTASAASETSQRLHNITSDFNGLSLEYTEPLPGPSSETVSGRVPTSTFFTNSVIPDSVRSALAVYKRAIQHEQQGELDEALRLYRQAFRSHPDIDRVYMSMELLNSINVAQTEEPEKLDTREREKVLVNTREQTSVSVIPTSLAKVINGFPQDIVFLPEDEKLPVHLNVLPEELLVAIIRRLDHTTIERFGAVSRRARVLTLDSSVWRELVVLVYKHPQIPHFESIVPVIARYQSDFRRLFVEHPRLRLDGAYIAVCHYVRPGLSENTWVNISHLITYHRYLRFFPDGKVLSLLANEETPPAQVIHTLKLSLRKKGLYIGTWRLAGSNVIISNLIDASGRFPIPPQPVSADEPCARYAFSMTLNLRSRPLGRWNKLELTSYNSVHIESGDSSPLPLKHDRPFWFSKVKSFPAF